MRRRARFSSFHLRFGGRVTDGSAPQLLAWIAQFQEGVDKGQPGDASGAVAVIDKGCAQGAVVDVRQ